jgi:DtxR family transcriptional regulator, Mn-dependent transcriptional regulator
MLEKGVMVMPRKKPDKKGEVTASMEDYLEAIFELTEDLGSREVRVTDIARKLGVTRPSVVGMLKHLLEHGLADHDRYGGVRLKPAGLKIARETFNRHQVLQKFLEEVLGLDAEVAERDACRMEHTLSPQTLERFIALQEFRQANGEEENIRAEPFRRFLRQRRDRKGPS